MQNPLIQISQTRVKYEKGRSFKGEAGISRLDMVTQPPLLLMLKSKMPLRLLLIIWVKKLLPLVFREMKLVGSSSYFMLSGRLPLQLNRKRQGVTSA